MDETQPLRVMLVEEDPERLRWVMRELANAGLTVLAHGGSLLAIEAEVARLRPDLIIIESESPSRDTLEQLCVLSPVCPTPIVLFTDDADTSKLRRAVKAGVSAYVVSGLAAERVRPVLEAAMARFEAYRTLEAELLQTRKTLTEKNQIEQAKRVLIRTERLTEQAAYQCLRKMAMDQRRSLAEVAAQIVAHLGA
mgnify:CR=1 FL=1